MSPLRVFCTRRISKRWWWIYAARIDWRHWAVLVRDQVTGKIVANG